MLNNVILFVHMYVLCVCVFAMLCFGEKEYVCVCVNALIIILTLQPWNQVSRSYTYNRSVQCSSRCPAVCSLCSSALCTAFSNLFIFFCHCCLQRMFSKVILNLFILKLVYILQSLSFTSLFISYSAVSFFHGIYIFDLHKKK